MGKPTKDIHKKIPITVFQALTVLAENYRGKAQHKDIYAKIKSVYLSGVRGTNDIETLNQLLQDPLLNQYTITVDRADINEDPVRRYFESQLCHATLATSLDSLDKKTLNAYCTTLFNQLDPVEQINLRNTVFSGTERGTSQLSGINKEYGEVIRVLTLPSSTQSFKPEDPIAGQSPEAVLKDRKDKMILLSRCSITALCIINNAWDGEYPLNLYRQSDSVYKPTHRGRTDRNDPLLPGIQDVESQALGIMRPYMPLPRNDVLVSETPTHYVRPADYCTYMQGEHFIPDLIFANYVTPFVNSISGTLLVQVRVMAKLMHECRLVYAANRWDDLQTQAQLKLYFKCYMAQILYHGGGHSLEEFFLVLQLPEVQEEFEDLPGFDALTLETLFKDENEMAFERSMEKSISYNHAILNKKKLHHEFTERAHQHIKNSPEGEDALTLQARARLKNRGERYHKHFVETLNAKIDKAYNQLCDPFATQDERKEATDFLVKTFRISPSSSIAPTHARSFASFGMTQDMIIAKQIRAKMVERQEKLRYELFSATDILAVRLDKAWNIYKDNTRTIEDRGIAQEFLIYTLNIAPEIIETNLNEHLETMMISREFMKEVNPEYVPGKSPIKVLSERAKSSVKRLDDLEELLLEDELQEALENKELLDVHPEAKDKDKGRVTGIKTEFYNPKERELFRVLIHKNKFMQKGHLVDTTKSVSNDKKGFAAFTLNIHGELSVFAHTVKKDDRILSDNDEDEDNTTAFAHSSLNAGAPVFCAGEIQIENGKLIAITDHSGHYRPSAYNLYKTLSYFNDHGIDISETKVLMHVDPAEHLAITTERSAIYPHLFVCQANDLCKPYHQHLQAIIKEAQQELAQYQTKNMGGTISFIKAMISKQPDAKRAVIKKMSEALMRLSGEINAAKSARELSVLTGQLKQIFETAQQEHKEITGKKDKVAAEKPNDLAKKIGFFHDKAVAAEQLLDADLRQKASSKTATDEDKLAKSDVLKRIQRR
ncbi:MAG: hypothetical protein NTW08_10400 [Gammaproteobacteria bacterium]|nr:hypothetical protein [Gammaproteobacteria bacterium]